MEASSRGLLVAFGLLGVGIIYSPWLFLARSKKLSGEELGKAHPRFAWMRWGFLALNAGWVLLTLCFLVAIISQVGGQAIYLTGAWIASVGLFNGLIAAYTRVCPVPFPHYYVYVYGDEAQRAGGLQAILAMVYIAVAIYLSV